MRTMTLQEPTKRSDQTIGAETSKTEPQVTRHYSHGILRILTFVALFALTATAFHFWINHGLRSIRTSGVGAFNRAMAGEVNAQIVISGSSRALVHYDPRIIERVTGKTAYNLGRNGSHTDMQVAVLKAYLRHNRKPELVIHNLDLHSFVPTEQLYDPAQYLPYLREPDLYEAVHRIHSDAWKWRYLPLYGYAVEDMRFTWMHGIAATLGVHPREDHFQGFNPREQKWTGDFEQFKRQNSGGFRIAITAAGEKALQELATTCAQHGVRIVFVYAPEYGEVQELTANRREIMERFERVARDAGADFWDYSASSFVRQRELFYNSQHLNRLGAEVFSSDLSQRLRNWFAASNPAPGSHSQL